MARKALSDERLDSPAARPAASSPQSRRNQATAAPVAASRGYQATTKQFGVELDARSRAGKVSPSPQCSIGVVLSVVILTSVPVTASP